MKLIALWPAYKLSQHPKLVQSVELKGIIMHVDQHGLLKVVLLLLKI